MNAISLLLRLAKDQFGLNKYKIEVDNSYGLKEHYSSWFGRRPPSAELVCQAIHRNKSISPHWHVFNEGEVGDIEGSWVTIHKSKVNWARIFTEIEGLMSAKYLKPNNKS